MNQLSKIIIEKRKQKGISQAELADRLHVTKQAVSKWETGKSMPDMALLPELAEALDVSVDELLTGKEPEKAAPVKDSPRKMPVRKAFAIFVPILVIAIVASTLMGVYIPRAITPSVEPGSSQQPENPNNQPEVKTPVYTQVGIDKQDRTIDAYRASFVDGKAYFEFVAPFTSDYELELGLGDAVATVGDERVVSEPQEWYVKKNIFLEEDESIKITIDISTLEYKGWNYCVKVYQKGDFEDITIPAGKEYVVAVNQDYYSINKYIIKTEGVTFTDVRRQYEIDRTNRIIYTWPHTYWKGAETNNAVLEIGKPSGSGSKYENDYTFVVLKNNNDYDVDLDLEIEDLDKITINQFMNIDETNGIVYPTSGEDRYIYYELNTENKMRFTLFEGRNDSVSKSISIYDTEGNKIKKLEYLSEAEIDGNKYLTTQYLLPDEKYYVVICTWNSQSDFNFNFKLKGGFYDWDE